MVDYHLCEGRGQCAIAAPEVFEVGDDDRSHVLVAEAGDELRPKVERAIRSCPRQAIAWAAQAPDGGQIRVTG